MSKLQKVILKEDITGSGKKYETKTIKKGFFRYLWEQNKVTPYNERSLQWAEKQKEKERQFNLLKEQKAKEVYQQVNGLQLSFTLKKNEKDKAFGSIGTSDILERLSSLGFSLEKKQLVDFSPLSKLGENLVKIKLSENYIAQIKVDLVGELSEKQNS